MGHRFSKSIINKDKDPSDVNNTAYIIDDHNQLKKYNNNKVTNQNLQIQQDILNNQSQQFITASVSALASTSTSTITTTYPMINKNISSTITSLPSTSLLSSSLSTSLSSSSTSSSTSVGQQFIIKIQLTKMETDPPITTNLEIINKNENNQINRNFCNNINDLNHSNLITTESTNNENNNGNRNKNSINIKKNDKSDMNNFNNNNNNNSGNSNNNNNLDQRNIFIDNSINNLNMSNNRISISDDSNNTIQKINNNITNVINDLNSQLEKCNLKLNKDDIIQNIPLPDYQTMNAVGINNKKPNSTLNDNSEILEKDVCDKKQHCSRRKKLLSTSGYPLTKRKCCKCCCRDNGTKKNADITIDSNCKNINITNNKDQQQKSLSNSKSSSEKSWTSRFTNGLKNMSSSSSESKSNSIHNKSHSNDNQKNTSVTTTISKTSTSATTTAATTSVASTVMVVRPQSTNSVPLLGDRFNNHSGTNQLAIWADNQMLVVQLPQASQLVLERFENVDNHGGIHQTTSRSDAETQSEFNNCSNNNNNSVNGQNQWPSLISGIKFTTPIGPKVHSQEDFIHCLVPDLEKITASSFYWGKMDRYEAERLLDGKPEGTFLLRDSAQEEYLFSVTFRKYDRSLHARIEQLNHKFSFDCHDPGVFTAPTVTGLLEHYKDPTCVMFFEPMLTIPLNRNFPFSLQQLCRATIVSNVSYDGINELQLPNSLKSYLKEYHYKLRVRVKPFDETFYTCS